MVTPADRRRAVERARQHLACSERRACKALGVSRSSCRYRSRRDDLGLRERLRTLAMARRRFGYQRLAILLRREGQRINDKRVYRIYSEEGLMVRRRRRKRPALARVLQPTPPMRPRQRWSLDFTRDTLAGGRMFRTLNVDDDLSRECLAIEVDTSLPGARVCRVLGRILSEPGTPEELLMDNGPEFTGTARDAWASCRGVRPRFITPGKPVENAFVENSNGRLRDECLNENWFLDLRDARQTIAAWREDYNHVRPHSSLGGIPPATFNKRSMAANGDGVLQAKAG